MQFNFGAVNNFLDSCYNQHNGAYSSSKDGPFNLYATCYGLLTKYYLQLPSKKIEKSLDFIISTQNSESGFFIGPELKDWVPPKNSKHDENHILMHLCCTTLPVLSTYGVFPAFQLKFAHKFLDQHYLIRWLNNRDWNDAWLEGNNLLFLGQLLIYLRDVEKKSAASDSLEAYFRWLEMQIDPDTGLWGTNGYCSNFVAMCGGYHQLLVYYYEKRPIRYKKALIKTVINLQHPDGGFHPKGGGGACEDVDGADILVNMYKQINYRRSEIRCSLRRLLKSILKKQMPDGGFVYRQNEPFSHMGIPATYSPANCSNMFATWFRVHTLALISEILVDETTINRDWRFNNSCSMGWHRPWDKTQNTGKLLKIYFEKFWCFEYSVTWRKYLTKEILFKMLGKLKKSLLL
jgi:hypothetical protein